MIGTICLMGASFVLVVSGDLYLIKVACWCFGNHEKKFSSVRLSIFKSPHYGFRILHGPYG